MNKNIFFNISNIRPTRKLPKLELVCFELSVSKQQQPYVPQRETKKSEFPLKTMPEAFANS